jgi:hypothetical protein
VGVIYNKHRRQTMREIITGFVGVDAHAESTTVSFAEAARAAPRFVRSVGVKRAELM